MTQHKETPATPPVNTDETNETNETHIPDPRFTTTPITIEQREGGAELAAKYIYIRDDTFPIPAPDDLVSLF